MKRVALLALATAAAVAWPPTREMIGEVLCIIGGRLLYGDPPERTPEAERRGVAEIMARIEAAEGKRVGRNGHAGGASSGQPI